MPRPWVKRLWAQGVQDAAVLAATFNVSPAAMNRRLQDLGLVETRERWRGQVVRAATSAKLRLRRYWLTN